MVGDVGEVDELGGEGLESLDIVEVGGESERGAHGAAGGQSDLADVVLEGHAFAELPADERLARDRERNLARAGVTETAGTEGEVVLARNAIYVALVDDAPVGVKKVERDRRATALPRVRTVDGRGRVATGMLQGAQGVE